MEVEGFGWLGGGWKVGGWVEVLGLGVRWRWKGWVEVEGLEPWCTSRMLINSHGGAGATEWGGWG